MFQFTTKMFVAVVDCNSKHCFIFLKDVEKVLYSQTFGGLVFAFFGGTPHIVLLTTAPLALYTKSKFTVPLTKSPPVTTQNSI